MARRRGADRAVACADLGAGRGANSPVPARFSRHGPLGRMPHAGRLAAKLPRQLLRSWYLMYFQLPWLPDRSASWLIPRLWRDWSAGYRADEDLSAITGPPCVAADHRPGTPNSNGTGCQHRGCRRCICTAPTTAAPRITRRGSSGCCRPKARSRSSRTADTSCNSISLMQSRVTSSTSSDGRPSAS